MDSEVGERGKDREMGKREGKIITIRVCYEQLFEVIIEHTIYKSDTWHSRVENLFLRLATGCAHYTLSTHLLTMMKLFCLHTNGIPVCAVAASGYEWAAATAANLFLLRT